MVHSKRGTSSFFVFKEDRRFFWTFYCLWYRDFSQPLKGITLIGSSYIIYRAQTSLGEYFGGKNWGACTQCYQMELRWRFRDLIKCFKNEKKSFNMQFEFILNGIGQNINKWLHTVFKFGLNTWLHYLRFCRKWPIY